MLQVGDSIIIYDSQYARNPERLFWAKIKSQLSALLCEISSSAGPTARVRDREA